MLAICWGLFVATGRREPGTLEVGVMSAITAFVAVVYLMWFEIRCTYVGKDGVAIFGCDRHRNPKKARMLLFNRAASLRAEQFRVSIAGIPGGTMYDYRWLDPSGRLLLRLHGSYRARKGKLPRAGDKYHFASAAEIAWRSHYQARAGRIRR
jgi:hypothetical protein